MSDREKLYELIDSVDIMNIPTENFRHSLADYLLSHGVVMRDKGEWINNESGIYHCPFCGCDSAFKCDGVSYWFDLNNFCPDCGADMRGKQHDR